MEAHAIGGPAARAHPEATPVIGATREQTAVEVARRFFPDATRFGLARRDAFPDALAGGAHSAHELGPVLLTPRDAMHPATAELLCERAAALRYVYVYGGQAALGESTEQVVTAHVDPSGC